MCQLMASMACLLRLALLPRCRPQLLGMDMACAPNGKQHVVIVTVIFALILAGFVAVLFCPPLLEPA